MKLELLEPLRELFKDEVRNGQVLGLPKEVLRHPFPGPGLVGVVGNITREGFVLREADAIL